MAVQQFLTHADLFAGIGGFQLALIQALKTVDPTNILSTIITADTSKDAERVYNYNFNKSYTDHDVRELNRVYWPTVDILTAGFPCQPFSEINTSDKVGDKHKSGSLYLHLLRIIDEIRPKMLIIENVRGFLTTDHGQQYEHLKAILKVFGYRIGEVLTNSSPHSPQNRVRWILVGFRKDLNLFPILPLDSKVILRPALYYYLDHPSSVDPLLYMEKDNWFNLLSKSSFKPRVITRKESLNLSTVTPTLLSSGRRGAQDIYIDEGRITPRLLSTTEQLKIMGFPTSFYINPVSTAQALLGNSIVIPHIAAIILPSLTQLLSTIAPYSQLVNS